MPDFAVHDGSRVLNVIIADTLQTAETLTGLQAVETNGSPWIDWTFEADGWRPPQPFPSWSWNGAQWIAPQPRPDTGVWYWDEAAGEWIESEEQP